MPNVPGYDALAEQLTARGVNVDAVKDKLKRQHIETPSWGYANSGTRFKTFAWKGAARSIHEKLADAGYIHKLTGVAPSVAIHIPWDKTDDYAALPQIAAQHGVTIGAVNPNTFQDEQYKLGSITHPSGAVREEAIAHLVECCEIMAKTGSTLLSLWFADGTNYAGQDSIVERKHRMESALAETYKHLPAGSRMLIEYKFFEPAFYHTDLADWGMAYATALKLGEQAQVLVDTGHHAPGTNIAHIVAFLLDEGRLGGFHLNARKYADDDLIVGTNNPMELFEIYAELVAAGDRASDVAYMIDQSHNIEPKLEAMIVSVINCQIAYAKALVIDQAALHQRQLEGDVLGAHAVMTDAFQTDVRPLLAQVRVEMGRHADPIAAYRADDYAKRVGDERGAASGAGGGFPT
ncbi:MAG: L-rhamnose isomerase [Chloroflexota bacterium]|nr:L-rhamnose isomerase [Chloroflexota bacterium]